MDKYEYWFLDAAVLYPIGISWTLPDEYGYLGFGRAPLKINGPGMMKHLVSIFEKSWVLAYRSNLERDLTFVPTAAEIKKALIDPNDSFFYFLTPEGAAQWERFSQPNWGAFYNSSGSYNGPLSIRSQNKIFLEKYLEFFPFIPGNTDLDFSRDSVSWSIIKPWEISYWKTLDFAHVVTVELIKTTEYSCDSIGVENFLKYRTEADRWITQESGWYYDFFSEKMRS
jgi:hypothetical protein